MLSIIIPVHNASVYLEKALGALESFDRKNTEIIVIDDASTDESSKIAARYNVKLFRLTENKGPGFARNTGARAAEGDILFFCDADIVLPENTLEIIEGIFKRNPDTCVFSGIYAIDRAEKNIFSKYRNLKERHEELSRPTVASACRSAILVVKKKLFNAVGGFDEKWSNIHCEDTIFCSQLAKNKVKIFINPEFEAYHIKKYSVASFLKQAFERSIAAFYTMRKLGNQFMKQYYKKDSYLNLILEISMPAFTIFSCFIFFYSKLYSYLVLGILFLFAFIYTQKDFYLYAHRIFGKKFVFSCFLLRFAELIASEVGLASVFLRMHRKSNR